MKGIFSQVILLVFCVSLGATEVDDHFESVKEQVTTRWQTFQMQREFKPFQAGKSDALLMEEFENINTTRQLIWKTEGFERAQHLIAADLIRAPGCVAFAYNNTVPYYNASTILLGDRVYIACEGPRSKDIPAFFYLLTSHCTTHLVRLTGSYEGWMKKCHPYWEGVYNGNGFLDIPENTAIHPVRAFQMSHWKDHQGVDPDELLAFVLQVRQELDDTKGLLTVHCSAGVGRTGTFLASLAIVDAIDQGESFSIEEIVYRLSLQRVHSVARPGQYITLHRLAESYLRRGLFRTCNG